LLIRNVKGPQPRVRALFPHGQIFFVKMPQMQEARGAERRGVPKGTPQAVSAPRDAADAAFSRKI